MKKTQSVTLLLSGVIFLAFTACNSGGQKTNADSAMSEIAGEMAGLKTMMIEYKTTVNAEGMKSSSVMTQWIDNTNDRHAVYTQGTTEVMGMKTEEKSAMISRDGWSYMINLTDQTGFKSKDTESDEDPTDKILPEDNVTFRQMIEKEGGKILGNENFLGKDCIVVEITENEEGRSLPTKMWYYKGIPLKMANSFYTMEATKFEENITIPDSRFEIPAGIKITEMPEMPEIQ
ncbi:MAG: hypothetical protein JNL22_13095 [Bacteroidales bacterium]|nr:hypothetical protein [Bacteroidales bacterium]